MTSKKETAGTAAVVSAYMSAQCRRKVSDCERSKERASDERRHMLTLHGEGGVDNEDGDQKEPQEVDQDGKGLEGIPRPSSINRGMTALALRFTRLHRCYT